MVGCQRWSELRWIVQRSATVAGASVGGFLHQPGRDRPRRGAARSRHQRRKPAGRRGRQCERLSLGRVADARVIHCFDKATGARIPANDITRGYDIGSLAIAGGRGEHLGHVPPPGDATIQKISTDGTATVSVDFTIDLDARHDHLTEKDGLLYVSCGTNGAQAFVVAVDPVQETALAARCCPIPAAPRGWSGSKGSSSGRTGRSSSPITAISTTAIRAIPKRPCNGRARISSRIHAARSGRRGFRPVRAGRCQRPRGRLPLQFGSALDA
jgi:hypothetical protein